MTTYINTTTGEYPRHIGDILIEHPNADPLGETLPTGWARVRYIAPPLTNTYDPLIQRAVQLAPLLEDGIYSMQWTVRDMTESELAAANREPIVISEPLGLDTIVGAPPDVIG